MRPRPRQLLLVVIAAGWVAPVHAEVVETVRGATAYTSPAKNSRHERGVVRRKARFEVLERSAGAGCSEGWLRIADRAWICAGNTRASDQPASDQALPILGAGKTLPYTYVVTQDAVAYATLEDAVADRSPKKLPGLGGFVYGGSRKLEGKSFVKTGEGWIPRAQARVVSSISFHGVKLSPGDQKKRLAFVGPRKASLYDAAGERLAATPLARQSYLGEVGPATRVGKQTLHRLASGEYIDQKEISLVEFAAPPAEIKSGERWIDVQLSQQTLVAYEGSVPVFATIVSTANTATPTGLFRVEKKRGNARLKSKATFRTKWDVYTPWVISIDGPIAIHAVYWHENFGRPKSQGCVNMAPLDAKWVWDFTQPALPPGWVRIETRDGAYATPVRIRR